MSTSKSAEETVEQPIAATVEELSHWLAHGRRNSPVYYDEQHKSWQVLSYADVTTVLNDPQSYLANLGDLLPSNPDLDAIQGGNFVNMDGDRHKRLRGLAAAAFTPRVVRALGDRIAEIATGLIDELPQDSTFDAIAGLAYPLPVMVIAELMGIPQDDRDQFGRWAAEFFPFDEEEPEVSSSQEAYDSLIPTVREMSDYLLALIGERRRHPRTDLISGLVQADVEGERLTDGDIVGMIALLLTAGHVTTVALIGNALALLAADPKCQADVRADPSLVSNVIEETSRLHPPLPRLTRRTARDVTLGGQLIPRDEIVVLWLASANRDEHQFPEAALFDINRRPNRHLAFGHGIHYCLGAPLAKLEAATAVDLFVRRFPAFVVDGTVDHHHPFALIGPQRLPLRAAR